MKDYQKAFLDLSVRENVLKFGQFTLKSARVSPYFFNAGLFNTGECLSRLGQYYAAAIVDSGIQFDVIFGPAYKGIPLVAAAAVALQEKHNKNVPYAFNRKEAKDHGEGGVIVGASLKGQRVLIIDDVITAGTAIREAIDIIRTAGGEPVGVVLALDRQEKGKGDQSAVQEVRSQMGLEVTSIVGLGDIITFLADDGKTSPETLAAIRGYKEQYGVQ